MAREKAKIIDLNTASEEELAQFKLIGPEKAKALVQYRNANGYFEDWSDLLSVPGFDETLVDRLESNEAVTLGTEPEEFGGAEE